MHIGESDPQAQLWAGLLSESGNPVLRVPELRSALRWWRAATGARIVAKGRLGDLRIAVLDLAGGTLAVMVGGPGALEAPLSPTQIPTAFDDRRTVGDPWGNTVVVQPSRQPAGAAA
ncbi:hypothetical protein [Microbacterium timonense]|uniref:hypothetical protein n=1 Tax=Microbacterium timonense TaxID=2086576 RepID=UPI000D11000E|nr:hypothetical protein [Microbacterium timonense]